MKRLERLIKLTEYLTNFRLQGLAVEPIRVINHDNATSKLTNKSGVQILMALPEVRHAGNSDTYTERFSTVIFVLEKELGAARTEEKEHEQLCKLLDTSSDILTKIEQDAGDFDNPFLRDLTLDTVEIAPETSIFGGWSGYSVELGFH